MRKDAQSEFTDLLLAMGQDVTGARVAADRVFQLAYRELRRLAGGLMRHERPDHTLQPTEIVHEVYERLVDSTRVRPTNRAHFFGVAARAMRQYLIQYARRRAAEKRGGDWKRLSVTDAVNLLPGPEVDVLELDDVLTRLAEIDERMAQVVEMRVFAGLTTEEVAEALGVSRRTVQEDWRVARSWLRRELSE